MILKLQRKTPNNACRAELGRFPLIINMHKRSLKFWMHLKSSPTESLHFKAIQTQELNPEKSPLSQLVLRLTNLTNSTNTNQSQTSTASHLNIKINQIIKQSKNTFLEHWDQETKTQSKLQLYRTIKSNYELEDYLQSVRDTKQRRILTKYRLSEHRLAIETGRHRKSWLPREQRVCVHCETGEIETETHFLLHCHKYISIRNLYFNKLTNLIKNFTAISETEQIKILLGEGQTAALAARYVWMCHSLRDSRWMCVCVCVCVCVCHSLRDSRWMCECVWVCATAWETAGECVNVCECVPQPERQQVNVCVCHSLRDSRWMCVCATARETAGECVCVPQPERQQVNVWMCVSVCHSLRDSVIVYCVWPDLCVTLLSTTVILSMYACMFLYKLKTVVSNVHTF